MLNDTLFLNLLKPGCSGHKDGDKYQCSLQSIAAITTPFPSPPIGCWSVTTTSGFTTLVHDLTTSETTLSLAGSVDVSYFDPAGVPIDDNVAPLPIFKKIKSFVSGDTINVVDCEAVPYPEIPPFFIPEAL
ncbi:hypothetical protein AU255_03960 [Methyloprofundus sedimenti]|uniref:Uncharacterized protein n=1 Tax=Methyloprofundus sedimenti TaxID=1420851 RepID=A0A1V8M695_9GAMM|nr:hypothetical protein [Methyloprofundus sedimenti]OQK17062.1 hypothetical protein AU255_03960 [Methyloprofundus sedimenti]